MEAGRGGSVLRRNGKQKGVRASRGETGLNRVIVAVLTGHDEVNSRYESATVGRGGVIGRSLGSLEGFQVPRRSLEGSLSPKDLVDLSANPISGTESCVATQPRYFSTLRFPYFLLEPENAYAVRRPEQIARGATSRKIVRRAAPIDTNKTHGRPSTAAVAKTRPFARPHETTDRAPSLEAADRSRRHSLIQDTLITREIIANARATERFSQLILPTTTGLCEISSKVFRLLFFPEIIEMV
ncbi:hypothetical protein K0M31_014768 [Melipona bicolor]|uniref:Uncharacterized protein n=1 Tax=Melipona bicolor TaxID=60889 RepID=A0AA40FGT8_9HYME|nr:hypothetical protein K0M31_014768 [Melipona bicolor]